MFRQDQVKFADFLINLLETDFGKKIGKCVLKTVTFLSTQCNEQGSVELGY